ncbi:hypothetical protein YQ44_10455 [Janthinobacterium sp. 1_2014MBL_MicDiv]|nr:hypothetical protein YQ44_10455 [Janthinobacterium sp. 1_2014MBL_MicDiv]
MRTLGSSGLRQKDSWLSQTATVRFDFLIKRLQIPVKRITLISFTQGNQLNFDDTVPALATDAANILNFKCSNHLINFLSVRWLLTYITMTSIGVREKARCHGRRHPTGSAASIFDVEGAWRIFRKRNFFLIIYDDRIKAPMSTGSFWPVVVVDRMRNI